MTVGTKIQIRRDTAAAWTSANPVLDLGELALESDTKRIKMGDGATAWTALAYQGANAYVTVVEHGATASTARPAGAIRVFWRGTVAPTNAVQYDRWVNTTSAPYVESSFNGTTWDVFGSSTYVTFLTAATTPDLLITGTITRDANGAATSAPVTWPDGSPGTYTATTVSAAFPGAVDAYTITYGSPVTKTYTQAALTRNSAGAVTARPAVTVA